MQAMSTHYLDLLADQLTSNPAAASGQQLPIQAEVRGLEAAQRHGPAGRVGEP
jgi:hypothetical protein